MKGTPRSAASGQKRSAPQNFGDLCAPKKSNNNSEDTQEGAADVQKSNNSSEGTQKGAADVQKHFYCVFFLMSSSVYGVIAGMYFFDNLLA